MGSSHSLLAACHATDFTHQADLGPIGVNDHMPQLLERLSQYPIAGCFEDALWARDTASWVELRSRAGRPLVMHGAILGPPHKEVLQHPADMYMLGHAKIGDAVRRSGLFEAAGAPFMLQNTGGAITRAMVLHMMCTFPTATFHACTSSETWKDDVSPRSHPRIQHSLTCFLLRFKFVAFLPSSPDCHLYAHVCRWLKSRLHWSPSMVSSGSLRLRTPVAGLA